MPTILVVRGWRLFFYANERNEPPHIHARKGDMDCKYWLLVDVYDIDVVYEYNVAPSARRELRRIIFEHYDLLVSEYEQWHGEV